MVEIPHNPSRSNPMRKFDRAEIYIDIETIPTQEKDMQAYVLQSIKAPANYKDPEKIAAYLDEAKEKALDECGFEGSTNHIICIGVAIDDHPAVSFSANNVKDEAKMLRMFYSYLVENCIPHGNKVIGHNIVGYDLKIIKQRSMILGVKPEGIALPFNAKSWDSEIFDTMLQWDSKNSIKLEKLALALGIKAKKTMAGSDVYGAWKNGLHDMIADYCRNDVELTREVYKKMKGF